MRKKEDEPRFLVDYDLPQKERCTRKFYKKMKDPKFKGCKSTNSVVLTDDREKARAIHKKASKCGKSNLYKIK